MEKADRGSSQRPASSCQLLRRTFFLIELEAGSWELEAGLEAGSWYLVRQLGSFGQMPVQK
jgi:hypothetical protein